MSEKTKRIVGRIALAFGLAGMIGAGGASLTAGECGVGHFFGYGNCTSCKCKHFEGSGNICDNCSHSYARHY